MKKILNKNIINDIKSETRKHKISNLLKNNYDLSFDINNLSWERREIIKYFSNYGAITGSTLYVLYGLINRQPKDTDLLVDETGLKKLKELYQIKEADYYTFDIVNHIGYIEYSFNKKYYQIDIILKEDISYTKYIDNIRVDDLFKSIAMKLEIYETNDSREVFKDELDLNQIASVLKKKESYAFKLKEELNNLDLTDKPFLNRLKDFFNTAYKKEKL